MMMLMEPIPARLSARIQVPDLTGLALGYNVFRWPGASGESASCFAVVREDRHLSVYDLRDMLDGGDPLARIAAVVPAGRVVAPSPDARYVVVCDQRELRAVNADGTVRWRVEHPCWGCADMVDHGSEPACGGIDGGSAYVNADGTQVWAHIAAEWDDETETAEQWLVLDAADGTVLGSAGLPGASAGSGHLLHPDGCRAVLSVGFGQDGSAAFLGSWDGTTLTLHEADDDGPLRFDTDRVVVDINPGGHLVLTTPHSDEYLAVHQMPDLGCLVQTAAESIPQAPNVTSASWDYAAAFLDSSTLLAVLDTRADDYMRDHWLLDCDRGPIGPIAYPVGSAEDITGLVALGDGTWATIDATGDLCLWARP